MNELTKLQKGLVLSAVLEMMKKTEIQPDFKPSELMKMGVTITEEVEHLSQEEQDEVASQAMQDAARIIYNSLMDVEQKKQEETEAFTDMGKRMIDRSTEQAITDNHEWLGEKIIAEKGFSSEEYAKNLDEYKQWKIELGKLALRAYKQYAFVIDDFVSLGPNGLPELKAITKLEDKEFIEFCELGKYVKIETEKRLRFRLLPGSAIQHKDAIAALSKWSKTINS